jgi:hypothetical protein
MGWASGEGKKKGKVSVRIIAVMRDHDSCSAISQSIIVQNVLFIQVSYIDIIIFTIFSVCNLCVYFFSPESDDLFNIFFNIHSFCLLLLFSLSPSMILLVGLLTSAQQSLLM